MQLEKTATLLRKYDYDLRQYQDKLVVKLPFSQEIHLDYSEPSKIGITSKLVSWNFLTGILEMRFNHALIYSLVGLVLMGLIFPIVDISLGEILNYVYLVVVITGWVLMWTTYYTVSFYSFKQTFIQLNEREQDL